MAQFTCDLCGAEFNQKSRYDRHFMTSHPKPAPSAASIEKALKGVAFPKTRDALAEIAVEQGEITDIIQSLPDKEFRDAAEVARAFGELRSHRPTPDHQPSKRGGAKAMEAPSAAKLTSLFSGIEFPASGSELKKHAQPRANENEMKIINRFDDHTYNNMADVAKEIGRVS